MTKIITTNSATNQAKLRVSGVILIDKPKGLSSQQVVSKVKYLFKSPVHNSKKAGHTGTLDPMATGLLPICLGESTKFSHYQLDADKVYEAIIQLGSRTDTGDAEGDIIETAPIPVIADEHIAQVVHQFTGQLMQIPPMYSALKKDGKKLYEYARAGIEVEREPRLIHIKSLMASLLTPDTVSIKVTCSKGTYIRVLGEDIAGALGTNGHLTALRRVGVGHFAISDAIDLASLETLPFEQRFENLLSVDACIADMPYVTLEDTLCHRLRLGQRINIHTHLTDDLKRYMLNDSPIYVDTDADIADARCSDIDNLSQDIRIFNTHHQFVGLASLQLSGRLQPKKMINI